MARPCMKKRICSNPKSIIFHSENNIEKEIEMTMEEYECIKHIDYEALTQEECSKLMNTSRATVQALYEKARYKLSVYLIEGGSLKIQGGAYFLCPNREHCKKECNRKCLTRLGNIEKKV